MQTALLTITILAILALFYALFILGRAILKVLNEIAEDTEISKIEILALNSAMELYNKNMIQLQEENHQEHLTHMAQMDKLLKRQLECLDRLDEINSRFSDESPSSNGTQLPLFQ